MATNREKTNSRLNSIVDNLVKEEEIKEKEEIKDMIQEIKVEKRGWDVLKDEPIPYFDARLSYELTGYKPIDGTHGLDFDPEWFLEARRNKEATGKYCDAPKGSKAYRTFWNREYKRCRDGMSVNGYTITGDNYFFINYYQLMNLDNVEKAGGGREMNFANFYVKQYEYFHYIEMCKLLRKDAIGLKARGIGFSEIGADVVVNTYNCRRHTRSVVAAQQGDYVERTLAKCWDQLDYLNQETEDAFKKLRQVHNSALWKKASVLRDKNEDGWLSEIQGIIADTPKKIRGDRCDILIYEESGSWPNFRKAYGQGEALVKLQGQKIGIRMAWGTGGDSGANLEGLADAFYNPEAYDALPYKHNYTSNGEEVITGYFIPAYTLLTKPGYIDKRGWTDPEKGKAYYQEERNKKINNPKVYLIYCAEYCFTPEEALALEGTDEFNTVDLAEQLANITIHKLKPEQGDIETGFLEYVYDSSGQHKYENVSGFKWIPNDNGHIHILEHPLKNEDGSKYQNLYVAGIDSIDLGASETSSNTTDPSQFCLVIKRRAFGLRPAQYVCYYKDRPKDINEAYTTALKLLQYYNCQAVLESSKISLLTWFRGKGMANKYLMRRPRACLSDIDRGRSNLFGAQTSESVISHQLDLIRAYCLENSYEIWFTEMLEELIKYSYENKRKFDIVAALGMCELGDEELTGITIRESITSNKQTINIGYYIDEYGHKRFGEIPSNNSYNINPGNIIYTNNNDLNRVRSSNPRYATKDI